VGLFSPREARSELMSGLIRAMARTLEAAVLALPFGNMVEHGPFKPSID